MMLICISAEWLTALSTTGLLIFTVALVIIAFVTYLKNEKYNRLQAVKTTVFKMIDLHNNIISNITPFQTMYDYLKVCYNEVEEMDEKKRIKMAFNKLYLVHSEVGKYYKNLYLIIEYIQMKEQQNIIGLDSNYYIRLIKAQLSKYEILMLAYNCVWIEGETDKEDDKEFIRLARCYKLFSALEDKELIKTEHKNLF